MTQDFQDASIGRVEVSTIPLPAYVRYPTATYTSTGSVFVSFRKDTDPKDARDYYHFAVMNDDGSDFREIFEGNIPQHPKANGIRYMPYADGKRLLLGDYVAECTPDIDHCESVSVIPVKYPFGLEEDRRVFRHWSEIIISPDCRHICWTYLTVFGGAGAAVGELTRKDGCYVIEHPQLIHSTKSFEKDPEHPGFMRALPTRGGEVKQFVHGGTAISAVGAAKTTCLADSVIQDLVTGDVSPVTRTPGYDETTLLSPDERLGITMSPRFSKKTSFDIIGLLPRPYCGLVTTRLIQTVYLIAVTEVRLYRPGNVGPALVSLRRSASDPFYKGVDLHDPEEKWLYNSPMSWRPDGKSAIWPENLRGSRTMRLRRVSLPDYVPGESVKTQPTPDHIPYGLGEEALFPSGEDQPDSGQIAGKASGSVSFRYGEKEAFIGYQKISDDGEFYWTGSESVRALPTGETLYQADVERRKCGSDEAGGCMKLQLVFSKTSFDGSALPELEFGPDENGEPKSRGFAEYGGRRISVSDLR